ncbi:proteasome accessory factor A [Arcanobacterium pluranimalium]|uniref:depupylase/deamidase Dop n=1 Tax=Arcanobacterium pluranimalium TaxID=108028 RepID=UPI00195CC97E|nr:depupylase/deamidase Dop [Arcanobacterium pluranimalium]MBM7825372.1 proteasome accessory factor A [Arcanobacterium pluranimalium]
MSVRRSIGLETEFGIIDAQNMSANPIVLSTNIVDAYGEHGSSSTPFGAIRWDYDGEDPLNDARGYRIDRAAAHPSLLTDDPQSLAPSGDDTSFFQVRRPSEAELALPRAANAVLKNGARLYVDHAHPEYSAPEVINPREAVLWDRAGEYIAREAMALASTDERHIVLYKNNVDGKGAAYGTHENYLVRRDVDFNEIIRYLTPFFVTRPIICGAGRVGIGPHSEQPGFQISQRADYVENDVGLETTFNRPIINTRDEPHADASLYRRLHVIGGDANQFDYSNLLKIGTTSLLLWLLEQDEVPLALDSLVMYEPVRATWEISHDPHLNIAVDMHDGTRKTALDIQQIYLDVIRQALERHGEIDLDTQEILVEWQFVLDALRKDIFLAASRVEWVAKYQMLSSLRERGGLAWDADKLRALDLQWHDLRSSHSIVGKLDEAHRIARIFTPEQIEWAVGNAPLSTRAFLRGGLIRKFPQHVAAASWNGITIDLPCRENLLRIPLMHPQRASSELLGKILEESHSIEEFMQYLGDQ